ncbi:hypothetical protein HWV23_06275 [Natronomonas halophila]|jgi:hypothetical protein|nr:hypothetical protein [Natronomonas halophila]QLD85349.1 hypothetical protein HWV23_06275 [Natronomonas halophila]
MSARNLLPVAAALTDPIKPALPPTTRAGLLARVAAVYWRLHALVT